MKRFVCWLALCCMILCAGAGCGLDAISGVQERTFPPDANASPLPIEPVGGDVAPGKLSVTLYYRYNSEPYLAPYPAQIEATGDKPLVQTLLEQLIQGPDGAYSEYSALIDPRTRVLAIQEKNGYLEVTLSEQYFDSLTPRQSQWDAGSELLEAETRLRKQLALYSIVNTITEMGRYSRVMIMIDRESGIVDKLKRSEAGLEQFAERAIDPLGRDISCVITLNRSASLAMDALRDREWSTLGLLVAAVDIDGSLAPYSDELAGALQSRPALIDYEISGEETIMPGRTEQGIEQAVLRVDVRFRDALGNIIQSDNIPLRMVRQTGVWRIPYASLDMLVPKS